SYYRGEVGVIVDNIIPGYHASDKFPMTITGEPYEVDTTQRDGAYIIRKGDRIAQGIIAPITQAKFVEVSELSETERGEGGFGSSGVRFRKESRKLSDYHTETTIYLGGEDAE